MSASLLAAYEFKITLRDTYNRLFLTPGNAYKPQIVYPVKTTSDRQQLTHCQSLYFPSPLHIQAARQRARQRSSCLCRFQVLTYIIALLLEQVILLFLVRQIC